MLRSPEEVRARSAARPRRPVTTGTTRVRSFPRGGPERSSDLDPPTARGPRLAILVADGAAALVAGRAVARALAESPSRASAVLAHRDTQAAPRDAAPSARPGAVRLAGRLRGVALDARARGRTVEVALPADGPAAHAAWERADAAADSTPLVLVLGGPRTLADDVLLARQDDVIAVVPRALAPAITTLHAADATVAVRTVAADLPGAAVPDAIARRHPGVRAVLAALTADRVRPARRGEEGQALLLVLGALMLTLVLAAVAGALAAGLGAVADDQRAADLAALAAARSMAADYADVDIWQSRDAGPATGGAMARATYLARAARAARATAARNGAARVRTAFPAAGAGGSLATATGGAGGEVPLRVRVTVTEGADAGRADLRPAATAEAELVPPASAPVAAATGAGEYSGPLAFRDGKPMRPDVALAYDRMRTAARADGVPLVVVSGYRSDAEQAVLFARRPDPKWVAPPGRSLHRLGTELDLGPNSSWPWLARNARRFGFVQRYSWEDWHFGFVGNPGSASVGYGSRARVGGGRAGSAGDRGPSGATLPSWVPTRFRPMIARAAQRWNVGAVLLAAQLKAESNFVATARSPAGALGIAQFMPATARQYGLRDPRDPAAAIDAQAHLMRDLLRAFGAVPLALAAYNAGPAPVRRCGCAGPYAETRRYVATILALILGAGDAAGLGADHMSVRLVR